LPQSQNGYSYANNNPINYTDPTGLARIKIWVSAFISPSYIEFPYAYGTFLPFTDFDAKFEGDNRSFYAGGNFRPSARQWHEVVLDTSNPSFFIVSNEAGVGTTRVEYEDLLGNSYLAFDTAPPPPYAGIAWLGEAIFVSLEAHVSNPLVWDPLSPAIDYEYNFIFDLAAGEVSISGIHDWFPWHEVYIEVNGTSILPQPVNYSPSEIPVGFLQNPIALGFYEQPVNYFQSVPELKEDSVNYCVSIPASISYSEFLVGGKKAWYDLLGIGN
jgi:hypothetical protein